MEVPARVDWIVVRDTFNSGLPYPNLHHAAIFAVDPSPGSTIVPSDHYGVCADLSLLDCALGPTLSIIANPHLALAFVTEEVMLAPARDKLSMHGRKSLPDGHPVPRSERGNRRVARRIDSIRRHTVGAFVSPLDDRFGKGCISCVT